MDDIERFVKSFIDKVLGGVSETSSTGQIILGASSGWVTGLIAMRIGKTALVALGGGIILVQIANERGYITINWDKVTKKVDKVANRIEENVSRQGSRFMDRMVQFAKRNPPFSSGFVGGFLIGLGSH